MAAGGDAGQPVFDEDNGEELMHMQPGVSIVLGNRPPEFPGTLYISTKQVVWLSDTDRAKGYAVDIVSVSLHAVSRDPEAYPSPCIYAQIETGAEDDEMDDSDSESNDNLDLSKITEMRIVPSDPNQVDALFAIFCECAELNPDPIEDEDDEGHNWNFSADQLENEGSDDEDSEFTISQNSTHTIGANGNNDLAPSVVQPPAASSTAAAAASCRPPAASFFLLHFFLRPPLLPAAARCCCQPPAASSAAACYCSPPASDK